jgi:hypothetical protein
MQMGKAEGDSPTSPPAAVSGNSAASTLASTDPWGALLLLKAEQLIAAQQELSSLQRKVQLA